MLAALSVVVAPGHAAADGEGGDGRVDPGDRDAVLELYDQVWGRPDPDVGWTGSVEACTPGTASQTAITQTIERVNAYRSLSGVPPVVVEDTELSQGAQAAALIMYANDDLSHYPPPDWRCWSDEGFLGARSNLSYGRAGVRSVDLFVVDPGDSNARVGHRWWLLRPWLRELGVGLAGDVASLDANTERTGEAVTRDPNGFVRWPNEGYVAEELVAPRWSVMDGPVSLASASVEVSTPSGAVDVHIDHRSADRIVFVPDLPASLESDGAGATPVTVEIRDDELIDRYTVRVLDRRVSGFVPMTPVRVVDTRSGLGGLSRLVHGPDVVEVGQLIDLDPTVTSVTATITAVDPDHAGFLSVDDCSGSGGGISVETSTLNFGPGETRANLATVPINPGGQFCVATSAPTELLVDVTGVHRPRGDGHVPLVPWRAIDTRSQSPLDGGGAPQPIQIGGRNGVPDTASGATNNLTVTNPHAPGYVTVWPCDAPQPEVSNIIFTTGQTVANAASVRLDPNGQICAWSSATTDLLIDVGGHTLSSGSVRSLV